MDFTMHMPVQIFSGAHCLERHGEKLRELGRRCLIMTGRSGAKASGALDETLGLLGRLQIDVTIFPEIAENPLVSSCQQAAYTAELCKAQFIIGIGGGSVMDAAKAAAWLAGNSIGDTEKLFAGTLHRPPLPLVLIGTTAGTGSEVSPVSVLTLDDSHRKKSITHPYCYARCVFADPRYTDSMPWSTTVSTALDAFSHAAEGYLNPTCSDIPTLFAERAFQLIAPGLSWLAAHPDRLPDSTMREELFYGSLYAGMVLGAMGTAYPHPLGYILTEDFGVPHGKACAVFLPSLLRRAAQIEPERAARLFALCGGRESLLGLLTALSAVPVSMTPEQIESYSSRWPGLKNFDRTPGGFSVEEAAALYRSLFVPA